MAPGLEHVGGRQRSLPHGETADFWIPLSLNPANLHRNARLLNTVARLAPGVSIEQANAELDRLARLHEQRLPDSHTGWRATPRRWSTTSSAPPGRCCFAVFGAVGCVLLIACGNVACLTLGRSIARTREHAVRAALGASRARLAREILVESWVLALARRVSRCPAGDCGRAGARRSGAAAPAAAARDPRRRGHARLRQCLTLLTSLLCGLLPAWYGARTNLEEALREGGRTGAPGARSLGWHRTLVVAQIALCFVLLVCAGLLARTFHLLQRNPIGFQPQGVLTMTYDLPGP